MSVPNITATADIKAYVSENLTPAITDLLGGLASAIKAADVATAAGTGSAAYSAALVNVQSAQASGSGTSAQSRIRCESIRGSAS